MVNHTRIANGIEVTDTDPNIVTIYAVDTPHTGFLAHTRMSIKFEEPVPEEVRDKLGDPTQSSSDIKEAFDEYNPYKISIRHFVDSGATDSGKIEPHRTYSIELDPEVVEEVRDGFSSIARKL